jgi:DNA-binding beta-propeller fold protein YncE
MKSRSSSAGSGARNFAAVLGAGLLSGAAGGAARAQALYVTTPNGSNGIVSKIAAGGGTPTTFVAGVNGNGLNAPTGLILDAAGNVYVANYSGNNISKYSPTGSLISSTYITGLNNPEGLVFDNAGNLYVENFVNEISNAGSVGKYSPTGAAINSAYITGLTGPIAIALDSSGNLYTANYNLNTISKFSAAGALVSANYITGLTSPTGLAFDTAGNLFVTNQTLNTISQYSPVGTLINPAFASGLSNPMGLVFAPSSGNFYVANNPGGVGNVSQVTSGGIVTTYASGGGIAPQAIAIASSAPEPGALVLATSAAFPLLVLRRRRTL